MTFNLDNLRIFVAAVEHSSFSAAARALNRVPSTVSMAISNLEAEIGVALFTRDGREPRPTAQANALLPHARHLLDHLKRLNAHAMSLSAGLEASLTIAIVPELLTTAPWSQALRALAADYPLLHAQVLSAAQGDAVAMVRNGRADLALVFERYGLGPNEEFEEIGDESLVAVVAPDHPLLTDVGKVGVRDEQLQLHRQIILAGRDSTEVDRRITLSPLQWQTDNPSAALSLVEAGLGWALLPSRFVAPALQDGVLVKIPLENFTNSLRFYVDVVWSNERPIGQAAARLVELLRSMRQMTSQTAGRRK